MDKKYLAIIAAFVILAIGYAVHTAITGHSISSAGAQNKGCAQVADQKARDDCYHALAHSTNNRALCNNIAEAGEKEHCLGHVVGD